MIIHVHSIFVVKINLMICIQQLQNQFVQDWNEKMDGSINQEKSK